MSKLNKIFLALIIVLLIALGVVVYLQKFGFKKSYYAVYLSTGDIYFGKLNYLPKLSLTDVWFIQRNSQDAQNPLSLSKFKDAFWGPEDKIKLNSDNVVWMTKLRNDSQILEYIKKQ